MAYLDSQEQFSAGQSIATTGALASQNIYDTKVTNLDVGIGEHMYVVVQSRVAATSGGAAVIQLLLQTDDNIGFASPRVFPLTDPLAYTTYTANTVLYRGRLPIGLERYIRLVYLITASVLTGGTVDAYLCKDVDAVQYVPRPYTVS